ncbi:N-acetylmuramoyl-L-alanine amidase [Paucilactobacillus wasatchensis]|uniref:N-acetylmuramoyl-L-alanine amidase n=1 Tax=Paucilactobacillus wasatchensis TaxID=1335616 RepID=A0A0D1A6I0_9LACO|nr:N-acetylmuramoyl-L-alanine amidase [Paucilactobacillus wasatchensis]KIS03485.1 N-acetylmuramoyl-L-alanine amidase [Paucilactobacillus wasatchensis]
MNKFRPTRLQLIITAIFIILALGLTFTLTRQKTIVVSVENVNIRQGPGLKYKSIKTVDHKTRLNVLAEKNDWYKVRISDHKFGWIASWLVNRRDNLKKATRLSEATIVIDPGHGGWDSGAEYKTSKKEKYMEKTYTLKMAQAVATQLRLQGAHVIMTRNADKYVSLKARPALAEKVSADAFISFHFDSSPNRNEATGLTTYYYHKGASKKLAKTLNTNFNDLAVTNRGISFGDFLVIRDNTRPAVLCEMGYINDTHDFKSIKKLSYRLKVASKITSGLKEYFNE